MITLVASSFPHLMTYIAVNDFNFFDSFVLDVISVQVDRREVLLHFPSSSTFFRFLSSGDGFRVLLACLLSDLP